MGWFQKKPSMQETRAALGLFAGDPAPLHRYAPVFRDAINAAAMYRQPPDIADDIGIGRSIMPDQGAAFLDMVMQEFAARYGAIERIQGIRPDNPQLLDVHVAAVSYLEQFMMAADRETVSLRLDLQGDTLEASRLYAEAKRRSNDTVKARNLLAAELPQLSGRDRALYAALDIPHEVLGRLGLT